MNRSGLDRAWQPRPYGYVENRQTTSSIRARSASEVDAKHDAAIAMVITETKELRTALVKGQADQTDTLKAVLVDAIKRAKLGITIGAAVGAAVAGAVVTVWRALGH